jgi:hypothetical protein
MITVESLRQTHMKPLGRPNDADGDMSKSFGRVIDPVFTYVLRSYGFAMAAPHGKFFGGITDVNGNRAVEVYWIRTRSQYLSVKVRIRMART